MASLKTLDHLLTAAQTNLNTAAGQIRDLKLAPKSNLRKVAEALMIIFELKDQVYERRPDLVPDYLKQAGKPDQQAKKSRARPRATKPRGRARKPNA